MADNLIETLLAQPLYLALAAAIIVYMAWALLRRAFKWLLLGGVILAAYALWLTWNT